MRIKQSSLHIITSVVVTVFPEAVPVPAQCVQQKIFFPPEAASCLYRLICSDEYGVWYYTSANIALHCLANWCSCGVVCHNDTTHTGTTLVQHFLAKSKEPILFQL